MAEPFLSVIVPMYNSGAFLGRAVRSLKDQTMPRFEALFVDDGSTDGTVETCRKEISGDPRFRILEIPYVRSASAPRNEGIRRASGDYAVFLDSDDELEPDAMESIAEALEKYGRPDLLACRFAFGTLDREGNFRTADFQGSLSEADGILSGKQAMERLHALHRTLVCNSYSVVCRLEFLRTNSLFQDETLSLYEDSEWLPRVYFSAATVAALDNPFYHYIRHPGSITTELSAASLKSVADSFSSLAEFYSVHAGEMSPLLKHFWSNHAFNALFWYFFNPRYRGRFSEVDWDAVWPAEVLRRSGAMLAEASAVKRLAGPLIRMCPKWKFPARLWFSALYRMR